MHRATRRLQRATAARNMQHATHAMQRERCNKPKTCKPRRQNNSRQQTKQHRGALIYRQDATDGTQPAPRCMRHATRNSTVKHATCNAHNATRNAQRTALQLAAYILQLAARAQQARCNRQRCSLQQATRNVPRTRHAQPAASDRRATCRTDNVQNCNVSHAT